METKTKGFRRNIFSTSKAKDNGNLSPDIGALKDNPFKAKDPRIPADLYASYKKEKQGEKKKKNW